MAHLILNPKYEIRNSKQMFRKFGSLDLGFVSSFDIRISKLIKKGGS